MEPSHTEYETPPRRLEPGPNLAYAAAALRIGLGFIFFWAFLDKLFGFGYATAKANAWLNGGNPTLGYLKGSYGPFADFYHSIAGHPLTNALFMAGLCGVGLALLLGVGMRVAVASGISMLMFMWTSHPPWVASVAGTATRSTNLLVDAHVVYSFALLALLFVHAGRTLGLGTWWERQRIVKRFPLLQ